MRIYHNLSALNANRNLMFNGKLLEKIQEKLSSGLRINRAADDAAGLAISEGMRSQIRGLTQAARNTQDAISLIQTAEGALEEVHACLGRMRELAVQAANSTYAPLDQNVLQQEIEDLKAEIDRISETTHFNTKYLLDGTTSAITSTDRGTTKIFMRGAISAKGVSAAGTYRLDISLANAGTTEVLQSGIFKTSNGTIAAGTVKLRDVSNFYDANGRFVLDNPQTVMMMDGNGKLVQLKIFGDDSLADVAQKFNDAMANVYTGLGMSTVAGVASGNTAFADYITNTTAGGSESVSGTFVIRSAVAGAAGKITLIAGVDLINSFGFNEFQEATENQYKVNVYKGSILHNSAKITGNKVLGLINPNVDLQFDSNANVQVSLTSGCYTIGTGASFSTQVHLADNSMVFQIGTNELNVMSAAIGLTNCDALGIRDLVVNSCRNAGRAITRIDTAVSRISAQRSSLGAIQNRLEHTMKNLNVANENITAAESRIRDEDMASGIMELTKLNVLMQTGMAMLAQANQQPQEVLRLLNSL